MSDLKELRNRIDEIDDQLTKLFQERMATVEQVAEYKKLNGINTSDPERERKIIEKHLPFVEEKWQPYYQDFQKDLFTLSRKYQDEKNGNDDAFLRYGVDFSTYSDNGFNAGKLAREAMARNPKGTVNATVGSMRNEENEILAFNTVYDTYATIPDGRKASYAGGIQGNADFCETVFNWVNRLDNIHIPHQVVATPGGTGALSASIANVTNRYESILISDIAWGSYKVMAGQFDLKVETYKLVEDGKASINDMKIKCQKLMDQQGKVVMIINDPCHNPTGLSMGTELWKELITFLNELSKQGPITLINDIAYFDYALDYDNATAYMSAFNDISENVAIVIAFSCSKTLTAYGMRVGSAIILAKKQETADHFYNSFLRTARAFWSNVNNGFMDCFVKLVKEHKDEFMAEKKKAVNLLRERSEIFIKEAEECGLPLYPYSEGFFITVHIEDKDLLNRYYENLNKADIYTVKFSSGIRVAICSVSKEKCAGLAKRMKEILDKSM